EALRTTYEARGERAGAGGAAPRRPGGAPGGLSRPPPPAPPGGGGGRPPAAAAPRPFDLARDPMLRATALRLGADDHVLLLVLHHIAADGWSMGVVTAEIAALYPAALAGAPSPLPELAVQYADFAVWQREWLRGETLE